MALHLINQDDGLTDDEAREKAFECWVSMRKPSITAVARYVQRPVKDVERWRNSGNWHLRKDERLRQDRELLLATARPKDTALATLALCDSVQGELTRALDATKHEKAAPFILRNAKTVAETLGKITEIQDRAFKRLGL